MENLENSIREERERKRFLDKMAGFVDSRAGMFITTYIGGALAAGAGVLLATPVIHSAFVCASKLSGGYYYNQPSEGLLEYGLGALAGISIYNLIGSRVVEACRRRNRGN
jgi:hypothetical protein